MIHIEYIDVRDGRAFADNLTWLSNLLARQCNCRCLIFWNVGTSYLLSGGSVPEFYKINKQVMGVQIRSKSVNLKHKFVLVPLVYNKATCDLVEIEMARANGINPVLGQSFFKFIDYNNLVLLV